MLTHVTTTNQCLSLFKVPKKKNRCTTSMCLAYFRILDPCMHNCCQLLHYFCGAEQLQYSHCTARAGPPSPCRARKVFVVNVSYNIERVLDTKAIFGLGFMIHFLTYLYFDNSVEGFYFCKTLYSYGTLIISLY